MIVIFSLVRRSVIADRIVLELIVTIANIEKKFDCLAKRYEELLRQKKALQKGA
jgi:hypothetical protein